MKLTLNLFLLAAGISSTAAQTTIDNAPFADSLTSELYTSTTENECTSSLGVTMALSLVYPSAVSATELQMRTVMGYPENSQSTLLWADTSDSLTDRYQGRCTNMNSNTGVCFSYEPILEIANSVFVDHEVVLNATYAAIVGDLAQQLDFGDETAGTFVNQWVNESTNGLIESIVEEGPLDPWVLLAINSIYLKASWTDQFSETRTNQDLFYSSSTPELATTTDAHFMHQKETFPYSHEALPGYQVLQLDFGGDYATQSDTLSMVFVLPLPGHTGGMAASEDVLAAMPNLTTTQVVVGLPKFKFESTYEDDLKAALAGLGMTAAFEEDRLENFCVEDGRCDAFIDVIIQKTFIEVNEKGVEAAAVTAVGMSAMSAPPPVATLFLADRPFQFFLVDTTENLVIFEGQVGAPGIIEGSEAPLESKHADEDFWTALFGTQLQVEIPELDLEALSEPEALWVSDSTGAVTVDISSAPDTSTSGSSPSEPEAAPDSEPEAAAGTVTEALGAVSSAPKASLRMVVASLAAGFLFVVSTL